MPTIVHEFPWPDRLVVGTLGRPGAREFYLQARTRARIVTVALEKEQSALLAEKIDEVLDELRSTEGNPFNVPDSTPVGLVDNDPLEQPLDTQFRTGAMGLGWDSTTAEIVIKAYAMAEVNHVEPRRDRLGGPSRSSRPRRCWCASRSARPARSRSAPLRWSARGGPAARCAATP